MVEGSVHPQKVLDLIGVNIFVRNPPKFYTNPTCETFGPPVPNPALPGCDTKTAFTDGSLIILDNVKYMSGAY